MVDNMIIDDDGEIDGMGSVPPLITDKHVLLVKYTDPKLRDRVRVGYAMPGDCGIDLCNASNNPIIIKPNQSVDIPVGIQVKIPEGFCGIIRQRSSTFTKKRLMVLSGVIDSGYTGPLFVQVYNMALNGGNFPVVVDPFERIGQMLVLPAPQMNIQVVEELPKTKRGDHGFGSTGRW